jgi:hypothetical protein
MHLVCWKRKLWKSCTGYFGISLPREVAEDICGGKDGVELHIEIIEDTPRGPAILMYPVEV